MDRKKVLILKHFEVPKKGGTYARLICLNGENKGLAYYINASRIVLGRGRDVDLTVLDLNCSREHAEIVKVNSEFILTDLGSNNGTMVNELPVKQQRLEDQDKVIIGGTVYKFSLLTIEDKAPAPAQKPEPRVFLEERSSDTEASPANKKRLVIYGIIVLGLGIAFYPKEEKKKVITPSVPKNRRVSVAVRVKPDIDKEKEKKIKVYFSRGLRELREGNYFRAMNEFESALSWSPNDSLALFYLRKTKDALNKTVEELFNQGRRDEDSLRYRSASVAYCAVIRLLHRYPKDERYLQAQEKNKEIERLLGFDEGDLECLQEYN